jgi:hypothetical protein
MQKRQLMLLTKQNSALREKINKSTLTSQNITLLYKPTRYTTGVVGNICSLYIAPLKDSYVLCNLNKNLDIQILDCAEVSQEIWYEIRFASKTSVNNKGWILGKNIAILNNTILQRSIN